jgi:hypothetical protein
MSHDRYSVSDPAEPRFHATALLEDEELLVDIQTELESGERSAVLNGPYHLRTILARFFPRYKSIRTCWQFGNDLMTFNRATAAGSTPEEAALRTPFGHQVALTGLSRVHIRTLEGYPSRYTKIVVIFRKF